MKRFELKIWTPVFANDNDAYIPELWAQEGLLILENSLVASQLVYRDYSNELAQAGDTVNTRKPAAFEAKRKVDGDAITSQDAQATNVAVKLDQHLHTSFIIYDGEESKGFKNLVQEYLKPAVISIGEGVDAAVCGEIYNFMGNSVGKLGTNPDEDSLIAIRSKMNTNKVPLEGRNLIVGPSTEGALLSVADLVNANTVGDDGSALREGHLGRKFGINVFMSQMMPSISAAGTKTTGAVNNGSGYAVGSTTLTVDGLSAAITNGSWCTIAGDMVPQLITGTVGGATPTSITITPGLKSAVVDDAVVTIYTPAAINLGAGYALGWNKPMTIDGISVAPKKGGLISTGVTSARNVYGAFNTPTTTSLTLTRSLDAAVLDDAVVGIGPDGNYNFAFHRNAVALVTRPLAMPAAANARSFVASYNGLSLRVTIAYDFNYQGQRVTVDVLCGVKTLDTALGAVLYG